MTEYSPYQSVSVPDYSSLIITEKASRGSIRKSNKQLALLLLTNDEGHLPTQENATERDMPSGLAALTNPTATLVISKAKIIPSMDDRYQGRKFNNVKQPFKLRSTSELRQNG